MSSPAAIVTKLAVTGASESSAALGAYEKALGKVEDKLDDVALRVSGGARELERAVASTHGGVSALTGQFNAFATASAGSWKSAITGMGAAFGGMLSAQAVIGGVKALTGALTDFSSKSVSAAIEAEDSTQRLRSALAAQGAATEHNVAALGRLADGYQRLTRYDDEAIASVQALGLNIGVSARQIPAFTDAAVNMAAALRMDLNDAGKQLAMTLDGDAGRLRQVIPELAGMSAQALKAGGALDVVSAKFRGMAEADAQTLGGALAQLKNMAGEAAEAFGEGLTGKSGMAASARSMSAQIDAALPKIANIGSALGTLAGQAFNAANELAFVFASDANALADTFEGKVIEQQRVLTDLGAELDRVRQQREDFVSSKGMLFKGDRAVLEGSGQALAYDAQIEILKAQIEEGQRLLSSLRGAARVGGGAKQNAVTEGTDPPKPGGGDGKLSLAAQLRAFDVGSAHAQAAMERLGLSAKDQLAVVGDLTSKGEGLGKALAAALQDPKADVAQLGNLWAQLGEDLDALKLKATALKSELPPEIVTAAPRVKDYEIAAMDPAVDRTGVLQGIGAADALSMETLQSESEKLAQLVMQYGDLSIARKEQAIAAEELALQNDIERWSIEGVLDAHEREIAARQKSIAAKQKESDQEKILVETKRRTALASVAAGAAEIGGALSSVAAVTKSTKAKIAIQAAQNVIHGLTETAASAAAFARYDPVAGAAHAISAGAYYYAATQAGSGGGAGGAGAGGGGASGDTGRDTFGRDNEFNSTRERVEQGQRMPNVTVMFTGNGIIAGTTPQEFAHAVTPFIQEIVRESGGRDGTARP